MRTEEEIKLCIETLESFYPPGKSYGTDPIANYNLGTLAGLKMVLGEYPSFIEMDMEEFFNLTFPICSEKETE